jgi:phenylacetate-CoA ligase
MNHILSKYLFYYPVTLLKGEYVQKYLKMYTKNQHLEYNNLKELQDNYLTDILKYASQNSPYYEKIIGNNCNISNFRKIPFLTKKALIENINQICTKESKGAAVKTTGGSTGEPVKLFKNADALARERAATWRSYAWAKIYIGDRQARFWGIPHSKKNAQIAKIIDFISNRKRVSAFNLTTESLNYYHKTFLKFKPKYLYGYVSVIRSYSAHIKQNNLPPLPSVQSIVTTSEVLSSTDRLFIESVWGVKVFNEYGCGEVGSIAHECEYGSMHIMTDNLYLEIVDSAGYPIETGEVVVTDLFNLATPLIRYKIGDFATLDNSECPCGRRLPVLKEIHGRMYDIIKTKGGKSVHPEAFIYIFEEIQQKFQAFNQFQIVQKTIENIDINFIATPKWDVSLEEIIRQKISAKIDSNFKLNFIPVTQINREPSGKMRVVKSHIS